MLNRYSKNTNYETAFDLIHEKKSDIQQIVFMTEGLPTDFDDAKTKTKTLHCVKN